MIPAALKEVLSRWDPSEVHKPGSTAPKVLYTIPNGGNPTGASMTTQRKQEVYEVCFPSSCRSHDTNTQSVLNRTAYGLRMALFSGLLMQSVKVRLH